MEPTKKQYLEILFLTWYELTNGELWIEERVSESPDFWLYISSREEKPGYARLIQLSQFRRLTTPQRWIKWVLTLIRVYEKRGK